jgi:hypothetical protein
MIRGITALFRQANITTKEDPAAAAAALAAACPLSNFQLQISKSFLEVQKLVLSFLAEQPNEVNPLESFEGHARMTSIAKSANTFANIYTATMNHRFVTNQAQSACHIYILVCSL